MKIITQQLAEKLPAQHKLLFNQTVDPTDLTTLHSILIKIKKLSIYDITKTKTRPQKAIISVKDHINRTGNNPITFNRLKLDNNFTDLNRLYNKEGNSVIADCCGKELNLKYPYPCHYLCNISILAKAIGIQKISAYLINIS